MTNKKITEKIQSAGGDFVILPPSLHHKLNQEQRMLDPRSMGFLGPGQGAVGAIVNGNKEIDVYINTVIEEGELQTYKYRNKMPPNMLKQWFNSLFPHIMKTQNKEKKGEDTVFSVKEVVSLPDDTEISLEAHVMTTPELYNETEVEEYAKEILRNECNRELARKYYNDD